MSPKIEFGCDRRLQSLASDAGFYELPESVREGLKNMLVGAIKVALFCCKLRRLGGDPK